MSDSLWKAVDSYLGGLFVPPEPALDAALEASRAAGLPAINIAPNQGKLLRLLARAIGARTILEIGTLGGYSTIWLAGALPEDGRLVTLEAEPRHADVARANIARAGQSSRVDLRVGAALDLLPQLEGPFDFTFIDADKVNTPAYFAAALALSRRGSLIVVDNIVRRGTVLEPGVDDASTEGICRFLDLAAAEPRVDATAIQTVGEKGHDGFALALVTADP